MFAGGYHSPLSHLKYLDPLIGTTWLNYPPIYASSSHRNRDSRLRKVTIFSRCNCRSIVFVTDSPTFLASLWNLVSHIFRSIIISMEKNVFSRLFRYTNSMSCSKIQLTRNRELFSDFSQICKEFSPDHDFSILWNNDERMDGMPFDQFQQQVTLSSIVPFWNIVEFFPKVPRS